MGYNFAMAAGAPRHLPSFWSLQALGWGCYFLLGLLGSITAVLANPRTIRDRATTSALLFLVSSALHPWCRALVRAGRSWLSFALQAGALSLLGGAVTAVTATLILAGSGGLHRSITLTASVQFAFILFLWCSVYFGIKQWQEATRDRERLLQAETAVRDARLAALRSQLNPHFLFNSLNAVSTLVLDGQSDAATRMLAQVADLLRSSLDGGGASEVPLAQEIALTEQYVAIERTRLGPRLRVELAVAPETLDALVPNMLLQPLVENAVRHGVVPQIEGGTVTIVTTREGDRLHITIRNSGPPHPPREDPTASGIGLRNTAERLATLYGREHELSVVWPAPGGCEVGLELPFRKAAAPTAS